MGVHFENSTVLAVSPSWVGFLYSFMAAKGKSVPILWMERRVEKFHVKGVCVKAAFFHL